MNKILKFLSLDRYLKPKVVPEYILVYENIFSSPAPDTNPFEPARYPDGTWIGDPGALLMRDRGGSLLTVHDKESNRDYYFRLEKKWIDYIREATDPNKEPVYNECPSNGPCYCTGYCHSVAYYRDKI
mgnify:CR=1 FL=1